MISIWFKGIGCGIRTRTYMPQCAHNTVFDGCGTVHEGGCVCMHVCFAMLDAREPVLGLG